MRLSPHIFQNLNIVEYTTEIEYEGIEPSSTLHVLYARFSQANAFNNAKKNLSLNF
jgi:hypothetical protein